jgi:hypothetical protein
MNYQSEGGPINMRSNVLQWLQEWFQLQCDRGWEHSYGIRIDTLDNPGWMVHIDLIGTELENKNFINVDFERNEHDWIQCEVKNNQFQGYGGPINLIEILEIFSFWVTVNEMEKTYILTWLQNWYQAECNEDWEHAYGVKMETNDNPGWKIQIDLKETDLEKLEIRQVLVKKSDNDWYSFKIEEATFYGCGDPMKLELLLWTFRDIVEKYQGKNV